MATDAFQADENLQSSMSKQADSVLNTESIPSSLRRQWGPATSDHDDSRFPTISCDSLEKLVPTFMVPSSPEKSGFIDQSCLDEKELDYTEDGAIDGISSDPLPLKNENSESLAHLMETPSVQTNGIDSALSADQSKLEKCPVKIKELKVTKAVGYLVEAPMRVDPAIPAQYPLSEIVYIRFLVRPFTMEQLRQMITNQYGPVVDIWLNRIKSASVVQLESAEAATCCRNGLDGCRWPPMNPRVLRCDYGNKTLLDWMKKHGDSSVPDPPQHILVGKPPSPMYSRNCQKQDPSNDQSRNPGDVDDNLGRKVDEQPKPGDKVLTPAKLLDELFRKTTALPAIYWLPLTTDQALVQAESRKKQIKSNDYSATVTDRHRETRSPFAGHLTAVDSAVSLDKVADKTTGVAKSGAVDRVIKKSSNSRSNDDVVKVSTSKARESGNQTSQKTSMDKTSAPKTDPAEVARKLLAEKVHKAAANLVKRERSPFNSFTGSRFGEQIKSQKPSTDEPGQTRVNVGKSPKKLVTPTPPSKRSKLQPRNRRRSSTSSSRSPPRRATKPSSRSARNYSRSPMRRNLSPLPHRSLYRSRR